MTMSNDNNSHSAAAIGASPPPPLHRRLHGALQHFAAPGDEFVVSTTGETVSFRGVKADPPGHLFSSAAASGSNSSGASPPPVTTAATAAVTAVGAAAAAVYVYKNRHVKRENVSKETTTANAYAASKEEPAVSAEATTSSRQEIDPSSSARLTSDDGTVVETSNCPAGCASSGPTATTAATGADRELVDLSSSSRPRSVSVDGELATCPHLVEERDVFPAVRRPASTDTMVTFAYGDGAGATVVLATAAPRVDTPEGAEMIANRLCGATTMLCTSMAAKGIQVTDREALAIAHGLIMQQTQQDFEIAKETARLSFEAHQRNLDRGQKSQHHQERVTVEREVNRWRYDLANAFSDGQQRILSGLCWTVVSVTVLTVAFRLYLNFGGGLSDVFTSARDGIFSKCRELPGSPNTIDSGLDDSGWYGSLFGPWNYFLTSKLNPANYVPSSEIVACYAYGSIYGVLLPIVGVFALGWCPAWIRSLILTGAALIYAISLQSENVWSFGGLVVACALFYSSLYRNHRQLKQKLTKDDGSNPSSTDVNNAVDQLNDIAGSATFVCLVVTIVLAFYSCHMAVQERQEAK